MSRLLVILIICYKFAYIWCANYQIGVQKQKQASFDKFDNSCGGQKLPVLFNYTGLRSENNKLYMNTTITIVEDIPDTDIKNTINLQKCRSKDNLDSCEKFNDVRINDYCALMNNDNDLWGNFFSMYKPKFKCPFTKGVYTATETPLDIAALLLFSSRGRWYWKLKSELRTKRTERLIMCLEIFTQISELQGLSQDASKRRGGFPHIG